MSDRKRINPYRLFVGSLLPNWLQECPHVSLPAKCVYARLSQFAGEDGMAFPKQATLAKKLCLSRTTVNKLLAELEEAKLIELVNRDGREKQYVFLEHPWMEGTCAETEQDVLSICTSPVQNAHITCSESAHPSYIKENHLRESKKDASSAPTLYPDDKPKPKRKKSEKKTKPTHPLYQAAVNSFCAQWEAKYGAKYAFRGYPDGSAVNTILSALPGATETSLANLFRAYLADGDRFYAADSRHALDNLSRRLTRWPHSTAPPPKPEPASQSGLRRSACT